MTSPDERKPDLRVEQIAAFGSGDLHDLCDAAEAAIVDGGGFGWLKPPQRSSLESYWRGVLLVPERDLFVARLDGVIAGSAQLLRPTANNEAGAKVGVLTTFFLAPWARGFGLAFRTVQAVEAAARTAGLAVLSLDVRESQGRAIEIYEELGFQRWGTNPWYAFVDGRWMKGFYYSKLLDDGEETAS